MIEIGILGTLHDDGMRKEYDYSLNRMQKIIEEFNPDVICGEVRPEDWEKFCQNESYLGYLGPSEYRGCIIPLCQERNIEFIPVDWFEDDMVGMDYFRDCTSEEKEKFMKEFNQIIKEYLEEGKKSHIPFNSFQFNKIAERKQGFQNSINPEVHNMYWVCRNQIMLERIKRAVGEKENKRVLCTVGIEHAYYYYDVLKDGDFEIIFPLK